ncbi:MAG: hypothetical protein WC699_08465 [Bacteroidales bacterium]
MKKNFLLLIAMSLVVFSGCKRDEVALAPQTLNNIDDQILSSDLLDDVLDEVEYTSDLFFSELKTGFEDCRTVTVEPMDRVTWPKTITIDFGAEGCEVRDGVIKSGKIIVNMSGPQNGRAWTKVITFDNYFVNGNKVEGINTTTFVREDRHPKWTSTIRGGQITTTEGVIITRQAVHVRIQTRGIETPRDRTDDAFQLTGRAAGTRRDGKSFSWVITEPLVISNNCRWIRKGIKVITPEDQAEITVDYGDNVCDNVAVVTQNGVSKRITLKGVRR